MNIQLRTEQGSSVQPGNGRVAKYDWAKISEELSSQGCAVIERLLYPDECCQVAALYPQEEHFRSHATWRGMVSARVSIVTLNTRCRNC